MSRNGSMKEAILGIYLKERPQIISEALGFEVTNIGLEQKIGKFHADIRAFDSKRRIPVLFELQITPANKSYLHRMKKMIASTQEGVVVWVAGSFDEVILKELQLWLKQNQQRYVDFYAISLNKEAIPILQQLNDMYKLEIYDNLHLLDDKDPLLSIVLQSERIPMNHCGHQNISPIQLDYELSQDIKRGLLLYLRKTIPTFLNFHYDKKGNQYDHTMNIGAGKYGVVYRCSAKNRKGKAFVELYFDRCLEEEYEMFKLQKEVLKEAIHPDLTFNKRRIGVYFSPEFKHEKTFQQIAGIFDKMIKTFSPYFYGGEPIDLNKLAVQDLEPINSRWEFSNILFEVEERDFETEDSYRIRMENLGERFSGYY